MRNVSKNKQFFFVISGFRREVDENCALLDRSVKLFVFCSVVKPRATRCTSQYPNYKPSMFKKRRPFTHHYI